RVLEQAGSPDLHRIGAETITARYRTMRKEVMDSGIEIEAIAGLERVYRDLDIDLPIADVEEIVANLMREAVTTATPVPGALESIRMLANGGTRIGVVSSAIYHPFLEWTLEAFDV